MNGIPIFISNVQVFISMDFNFLWKELFDKMRGPHVPRNALSRLTISILVNNNLRKALQVYMDLVLKKKKNTEYRLRIFP